MAIVVAKKRRRRRKKHKVHVKKHAVQTTPKPKPKPAPKPKPTTKPAPKPTPTPPKPSSTPATPAPSPSEPTPTTPDPSPSTPSEPPATNTDPATWTSSLPVATSRERLYLNRFGTGFTQADLVRLRAAGSPEAWLAAQLTPSTITESGKIAEINSWFAPLVGRTPAEKYATDKAKTKAGWTYGDDLGNWTILRRIYSTRSVLETMTDVWSTLLHIPIGHENAWIYRFDYDATIRANALGTFEDLLTACALHPAMRVYLDNAKAVKGKPNENQGRELLELHTVGRGAGYTETMVKSSAVILSGYTVDWGKTFDAKYDATAHTTGAVQVLGFTHANTLADGQPVTLAYLKYLARHPATARRIATKLATYFVSDSPSDGLVDTLADVYTNSGTNISEVLKAISLHPEFLTSEGSKVRTPVDDLVATARVLGVDVQAPTASTSWAAAANYIHGADRLFSWPRPDGPPIVGAAWSSPSRMFSSYRMHRNQAGGWYPYQANYRTGAVWLPNASLRLSAYVDHLSRAWFGRAANDRQQTAATQAVGFPGSTLVSSKHAVGSWQFPWLAYALLDSPDHMTI
jgi:uncharacterized protein (DUF1800 family)